VGIIIGTSEIIWNRSLKGMFVLVFRYAMKRASTVATSAEPMMKMIV